MSRLIDLIVKNEVSRCKSKITDRDVLTLSTLPSRGEMVATIWTGLFDIVPVRGRMKLIFGNKVKNRELNFDI